MSALCLAALTSGCTLYGWGTNDRGQVGDGTRLSRDEPVPAVVNPGWSTIDAGPAHTCAIDASRRLFCWGSGSQAQLGLGDTFPFAQTTPHQVGTATDWLTVSAGGFSGALSPEEEDPRGSTCGIRAPGALYCWGIGAIGSSAAFADHPTQMGTATDWTQVSVGGFHACGIRTGALYCWGRNTFGQLGDGTTTDHNEPVRVGLATDWTAVTASQTAHTCGIRAGGLYCWGNNSTGQLGDGTTTNRVVPTRVGMRADWTSVTAGGFGDISQMPNEFPGHTCGIRGARELSCWGENGQGQLGIGSTTQANVPTREATASSWYSVSAGGLHTCAIRVGNDLFCWGSHLFDDPFVDPDGDRRFPNAETPFGGWASVSAGAATRSCCAPPTTQPERGRKNRSPGRLHLHPAADAARRGESMRHSRGVRPRAN
jgi:alpha-tubulin suppressor-like RCC1 family protein